MFDFKKMFVFALVLCVARCLMSTSTLAEEEASKSVWGSIGGWFSQTAEDASNWASQAWEDTADWISDTATGARGWVTGTANGVWNGVSGFFSPPSTEGVPNIAIEPDLPEGTSKMYLGYAVEKTGLDNGYYNTLEIGKDDPHFGLSIGKFYISGHTD